LPADFQAVKTGGSDADDFKGMKLDCHLAPNRRLLSAVFPLPECFAEDNAGRATPALIVLRCEQPPYDRLHTEHAEEISAHIKAIHTVRLAAGRNVETTLGPGKHAVKPLLLGANLLPLRVRQHGVRRRKIAGTAMRLNDAHLGELVRILERKRGQADGIEQLEDSGVGADAER
jgi:hypothetical protein